MYRNNYRDNRDNRDRDRDRDRERDRDNSYYSNKSYYDNQDYSNPNSNSRSYSNNYKYKRYENKPQYNETSKNVTGKRDFLEFNSNKEDYKDPETSFNKYEEPQKHLKTDSRDRDRDRNNRSPDYDRGSRQEYSSYKSIDEEKLAPWMSRSTQKIRNTLVRFHNEIIDFVNYVTPSKEDHILREKSLEKLTKVLIEIIPTAKILPFGSFATGLYLPHGDIDLVIIENEMNPVLLLNKIAKCLMKNADYDSINVIRSAKVPLIKLVEKSTNLNFDISFNKLDGVKQLKELQKGLEYYPEMKYLLMIMKCFLKQRDLNETYTGGIGSFLLFCLILTYLREIRKEYVQAEAEEDVAKLLLSEHLLKFMDFYINFDVHTKQIIIAEGGAIVDKYEKDPQLSVISPQDATHDVGGPSFKVKEVFGIFKNRYHFLSNYNFGEGESILKYLIKAESL